jgi:uncharacterized membrane protein YbhN (UPF0104 family)
MNEALRRVGRIARWVAPPLFLGVLFVRVDVRAVGSHLSSLDARFVVAFLCLSVLFYALCAWRWVFTASRLGVALSLRRAILEYYLSTLLNQVLPVGVAGDIARALRHRSHTTAWAPPVLAVALERLSGVMGLALVVAASATLWLVHGERRFVIGLAVVALVFTTLVALFLSLPSRFPRAAKLVATARTTVLDGNALVVQLTTSVATVVLLLLMFASAAAAIGVRLDASTTVRVVPMVLAVTTIPWAFGGWGARELSVATLFRLAGLDPAAGVAVSVTFGILSLTAATPGSVVLFLPQRDAT